MNDKRLYPVYMLFILIMILGMNCFEIIDLINWNERYYISYILFSKIPTFVLYETNYKLLMNEIFKLT